MKPGIVLRVAAVYMGLVGLGLILAPGRFGTGALPTDASAELIAFLRLWGSPLLGIAVLDWLMRDAESSRALDAVMTGNIVGFATIALIDVWGILEGGRAAHKIFAVVHGLFALAFILARRAGRRRA
jgi:hypothetical protein